VDIRLRYSADMALKHPWITRKFESQIPLTIYGEDIRKQLMIELLNTVRTLFFVSSKLQNVARNNKPKEFVIKSSSAKKPPLAHSYRRTLNGGTFKSGDRNFRYFI